MRELTFFFMYFKDGYPDRTYKIDPHLLTNALQQPPGYNPAGQYVGSRDGGFTFPNPALQPTYQPNLHSVQWWNR